MTSRKRNRAFSITVALAGASLAGGLGCSGDKTVLSDQVEDPDGMQTARLDAALPADRDAGQAQDPGDDAIVEADGGQANPADAGQAMQPDLPRPPDPPDTLVSVGFDVSDGGTIETGNGPAGEVVRGTDPLAAGSGAAPVEDGSLVLDGNTFVRIPTSDFLDQSAGSDGFSLAVWVKHDFDPSDKGGVIASRASSEEGQEQFSLSLVSFAPFREGLYPSFSLDVEEFNSGGLAAEVVLARGRWYHLAAVRNQDQRLLYVDGVLSAESSHSRLSVEEDTTPFIVGAEVDDGSVRRFFKGALDDLKLVGRPLSAQEIQTLASRPPP